ncbi:MAG TPA: hypothetical protein VGM03_00445, partial [Phycisphaerae bacterium]
VASEGGTAREAKAMLREAVSGYLQACFESNLPYLRPVLPSDDPRTNQPENIQSTFRVKVHVLVTAHA